MATFSDSLRQLKAVLQRGDVRAAITFLNGLTEHRFTSLYRFDDETLTNLYFFDRENPTQESTPAIPVLASYCVFVRSSRRTFTVFDALHDDRVRDHPKRPDLQSYCGVPLLAKDGKMFGTICHFDFRPIPISDENVWLLEEVGPLLRAKLGSPIAEKT
jgi:GAF domain-containing protein